MSKTRVYVGGLPEDVRERDVEDFFEGYGRLCDILIKNKFCFVEFSHSRDAEDAIHDLDGRKLLGKRVILQRARNKPRRDYSSQRSTHRFSPARRTSFGAVVENLSSRVKWQDLKDFLAKVGKVTYAKAHNVKRNQGMVEFDTYEDMLKVIKELDGAELYGRRIVIKEVKRLSRSRSPNSKSTSRSRSRSRSTARNSKSRSRSYKSSRSRSPSPMPKASSKRLREKSEERSRSRSRSNYKRAKRSQSKNRRAKSTNAESVAKSESSDQVVKTPR